MRKSLAAVASCLVLAFSASCFFSAHAMPAPTPDNVELSTGLTQWGAETEAPETMSKDKMLETLLELARPLPTTTSKTAMCETLAAAAQVHELPVGFFVRLINQESGFNPEIVSHAGAQGVAQFMPKVAQEWGLKNPFDPHAALIASARFLRSLYDQFGNWGLAAAAYNGGMGRVQKWIDKRGKLPDETRHYVMTITGVSAEKWVADRSHHKFSIPPRAPCQEIAHLADAPSQTVPLPPVRTQVVVAGPPSKMGNVTVVAAKTAARNITIAAVKGGTKVAVIKVKGGSKVATVTGKIAEPKSIVASADSPKGKRGKATPAVKLAEKAPPKSQAKAKAPDSKKGKGRIQVADARGSRK
jgi:hypothetical protein